MAEQQHTYPNLFVAGAPRSGTTSMCLYLKQHPDIHLSILKEPHFFATDLMEQPHTVTEKSDYLGLFTDAKVNAEGSVWYLISEKAPGLIKQHSPHGKVIIMLRRPWQQVQSLHALYLRTGNEDQPDLRQAIDLAESRAKGDNLPETSYFHDGLQYLKNASYFRHVKRFKDTFGDDLKVILFEDFILDPAGQMAQVFEFLSLPCHDDIEFDPKLASVKLRNSVLKQLRRQPPSVMRKFQPNYVEVHETKTPSVLTAKLEHELREYFRADIEATAELIGKDLIPYWYAGG